ncbi:hypothetical protein BH23PLA1_BH23PLA1_26140 [soil metagenome]
MSRSTSRESRVGLLIVIALAGLVGLLVMASGGPGYLTRIRTTVDVIFRDGQGIRDGQPVRVAGLDSGRVSAVDLVEHDGALRARVRLSIPSELALRLKQDAVITIQSSLTGQSSVNIASIGDSGVAWVPGQVVEGVESSMFDPILEQVGLGPVERGHISHMIAEVRGAVDDTVPRLKKSLASLQQSAADVQAATEAARPAVVGIAEKLDEAVPRVESTLLHAETLLTSLDGMVEENRPVVLQALTNVRDLSGRGNDLLDTTGPELEKLLKGLDDTRKRADLVLYRADQIATQTDSILTQNKSDLVRTVSNVRDATDYARLLVQKIYANPFLISPLYKPSERDMQAQANFDTAQLFLKGAEEFKDSLSKLETMRQAPINPQEQQALSALFQQAQQTYIQLDQASRRLAEGVQQASGTRGLNNR